MNKQHIAILMHEGAEGLQGKHVINVMADYWREDGNNVFFLYGTRHFVPADLLFVHVDLSVVPDSYLTFARRYPIVINGGIKDIRKETYSQGLLKPKDSWNGRVIVKTSKNYAGRPESKYRHVGMKGRIFRKLQRVRKRLNLEWLDPGIQKTTDYRIYDHLQEVPRLYFYYPGLIIQKFMPETENGFYCLRNLHFFGDRISCLRLKSKNEIVNMGTAEDTEWNIEPHPKLIALREQLGLDYGKFDYVIIDGQAILLDVNKTIGWPGEKYVMENENEAKSYFKYQSEGLYHFLQRRSNLSDSGVAEENSYI